MIMSIENMRLLISFQRKDIDQLKREVELLRALLVDSLSKN